MRNEQIQLGLGKWTVLPGSILFESVRSEERDFRRGDGERLFPVLLSGLLVLSLF